MTFIYKKLKCTIDQVATWFEGYAVCPNTGIRMHLTINTDSAFTCARLLRDKIDEATRDSKCGTVKEYQSLTQVTDRLDVIKRSLRKANSQLKLLTEE